MTICLKLLVAMLLVIVAYPESILSNENNVRLVIDHDGGADDSMAIFLALLNEQYFDGPNVVGLTTNHGNVNEDQVFINSQKILDIAKRREVPIYRGNNHSLVISIKSDSFYGVDGLGDTDYHDVFEPIQAETTHAVIALIELSKEYEGELVVVSLGPLTNVAMAVRMDPNFLQRLKQLYVAAGHVYSVKYPKPEFNARMDAEAYRIIAETATSDKVTVSPFSQTKEHLDIEKEWRQQVLGAIDTDIIKAQNKFETVGITKNDKWYALDPSTVAVILNPSLLQEVGLVRNNITLCGDERGIVTNEIEDNSQKYNMRLMYSIKKEEYQQFLLDVFSAETKGRIENN